MNAQAGSWKASSHVRWERKRHKISWGLCFFFPPKKKREKNFLKIWKIFFCFYAVSQWGCSFFALRIFIFIFLISQKVEIFCSTKCFTLTKVFFSLEKQFLKIVENSSPKWDLSVNGRSVGSLWEVEDNMEPTKLPTDTQKPSNGPLRIDQSTCHSCSIVLWLTKRK